MKKKPQSLPKRSFSQRLTMQFKGGRTKIGHLGLLYFPFTTSSTGKIEFSKHGFYFQNIVYLYKSSDFIVNLVDSSISWKESRLKLTSC